MRSKLAPMPDMINDTLVGQASGLTGPTQTVKPITRRMITAQQVENEYMRAISKDVVLEGKVYGLPLSVDTMAIFYNKDLLDRSGVAQVPTTWSEFRAAVRKITKYDAKGNLIQSGTALGTGNNIPGVDDLLYIFFAQSKINFVTDSGRPLFHRGFDESEEPGSSNYLLNFYTGFANKTTEEYSWDESRPPAVDAFSGGSVGFFFGYSYHTPVIKAKAPQLNFGIIPLLQLDPENPVNVASYWVQAVTLKSNHQPEAWGLIDFLTHSAATKTYLDATNRPSALRLYIDDQKKKSELAPFVGNVLTAVSWYRGQNYSGALSALQTMVREWIMPVPENMRTREWRQGILDRAAAKIEQTF
jgi:multiple sugar transport system substrate-binding protein